MNKNNYEQPSAELLEVEFEENIMSVKFGDPGQVTSPEVYDDEDDMD